MNRQNGIVVSFRNSSYYPDKYALNWTNYTEPNITNNTNGTNETDGEFDLSHPDKSSGNPTLHFLTDFE